MLRLSSVLGLCLVVPSGCRKVEPVPKDLDDLMHFIWQEMGDGDDELLGEAIVNLHGAIEGDGFEDSIEGEVSDLSDDEVAFIGRDVNPKDATGMLLADWIDCTIPELERVVTWEDQDELYVGVYDAYDRTSTSSVDAYLDGTRNTLTWDLEYETSALGAGYRVNSTTLVRRIEHADGKKSPGVVLRAHLVDAAEFDNPDTNQHLTQDYHLEVYWPHDGGVLHAYALWKDTRLLGFDDEQEATQRITLNKLADWDAGTSQLCQEGKP